MYKTAAFAGLVSLASAATWGSSAPAEYPPAGYEPSTSSAAPVSSSIKVYPSSSAQAYGSSSSAPVVYAPSSSAPVYAASSSSAPSSTSSAPPVPSCDCWSKCFESAGISSESELCGNTGVSQCIHDTCSSEEDKKYWSWYDSYCDVTSSSSYAAVSSSYVASSTSYFASSASSSASATPTPDCWNTCFDENDVTSESELCGNAAVNACIYYTCSQEDDMKYWSWYNGYCPAPSTSSATYSSATYSSATFSTATFSTVTYPVSYSSSYTSSVPSATPTGNCWNECFAENNVESEASLCGNDDVSKCIHDTCSSDLDKAYWEWYNSFCTPAQGTTTVTSLCTPTTPVTYPVTTGETTTYIINTEPYTTTYVETNTAPSTPKESSPVTTGWPSPPAYPSAPAAPPAGPSAPPAYPSAPASPPAYPSAPASPPAASNTAAWTTGPYSYPAAASGTGAWAAGPSASGYVPVPATGAGVANKPAGLLAVVLAVAAFF